MADISLIEGDILIDQTFHCTTGYLYWIYIAFVAYISLGKGISLLNGKHINGQGISLLNWYCLYGKHITSQGISLFNLYCLYGRHITDQGISLFNLCSLYGRHITGPGDIFTAFILPLWHTYKIITRLLLTALTLVFITTTITIIKRAKIKWARHIRSAWSFHNKHLCIKAIWKFKLSVFPNTSIFLYLCFALYPGKYNQNLISRLCRYSKVMHALPQGASQNW